jgi:branched-chain amino acid aminotransferase
MVMQESIKVKRTKNSNLPNVDFDRLEFGKYVSDHMLVADYENGEWQSAEILPYGKLELNPATLALHYGQTVFEGMKAFRMIDGSINIFRIDKHYDRFVRSLERMCMAIPSREMFTETLMALVATDSAWVPSAKGAALYLRPFMYASEEKFGVKVSSQYKYVIMTGPVPDLFAAPIRVKVETDFIRAARGGTGFAKCGGNYGGAFYPTQLAKKAGYDQVLWTTGGDNPMIEESGMMNVMFVIDGVLITAPLSDSILDGITRDSLLQLANHLGIQTEQRAISVAELQSAFDTGTVTEAFGAGTAAVVAPISTIHINGADRALPSYHDNSISQILKNKLESIRTGRAEDIFNWNTIVNSSD